MQFALTVCQIVVERVIEIKFQTIETKLQIMETNLSY